jgi:hypothetical protein
MTWEFLLNAQNNTRLQSTLKWLVVPIYKSPSQEFSDVWEETVNMDLLSRLKYVSGTNAQIGVPEGL